MTSARNRRQQSNGNRGAFPNNKDSLLPKEVIDVFFAKSSALKVKKQTSPRSNKIPYIIFFVLLTALALSIIFIILNKKGLFERPIASGLREGAYSENLIKSGNIDRVNVEELYFDGDARQESSFLESCIKLVNSGESGRAALVMRFSRPANWENKDILLSAKSSHGRKNLKLIFKDAQNYFCEFANINFTSKGGIRHIFLKPRRNFDFRKIKELRLEFGTNTAGNAGLTTIYLTDLTIRSARQ